MPNSRACQPEHFDTKWVAVTQEMAKLQVFHKDNKEVNSNQTISQDDVIFTAPAVGSPF